jgi:hypothetical protein
VERRQRIEEDLPWVIFVGTVHNDELVDNYRRMRALATSFRGGWLLTTSGAVSALTGDGACGWVQTEVTIV